MFIILIFLISCPSKHFDYIISNNELFKKNYRLFDKKYNIEIEFGGRYAWIANQIYSVIGIKINNKSNNKVVFNSGKIKLISKYFGLLTYYFLLAHCRASHNSYTVTDFNGIFTRFSLFDV